MNEPQRYSGPELGPLLRKVRDELGEDAAIVEANKVRSGGVAGFFTNEHYEVVADRRTGVPADHDGGTQGPAAAGPTPPVAAAPDPRAGSLEGRIQDQPVGNSSIQNALLERAEYVSTQEYLTRAAESDSISLGGDDFDSVLNHFLDDDTVRIEARTEHRRRKTDHPRQPPPTHRMDVPRAEPETWHQPPHPDPGVFEAPDPEPWLDDPRRYDPTQPDRRAREGAGPDQARRDPLLEAWPGPDQARRDPLLEAWPGPDQARVDPVPDQPGRAMPGHVQPDPDQPKQATNPDQAGSRQPAAVSAPEETAATPQTGRRSLLWRSMLSARGWQCPSVAGARVAWFIGPYAEAISVERRFGPREPHDVMHLSPETDLGPRWATTNSFDEALERCRRWRQLDVAGSIVVDYPADEFDPQLLAELSLDHCDAVHLVTDNLARTEPLVDLCHFAPVPAMVDLIEAPPSSRIAAALDAGLPIASILGMEMTPQMIVAIRIDAVHGEGG